jgi:hypothetical protein
VDQELLRVGGAGEPADGIAGQAQLKTDGPDGAPVGEQLVDGGVALPGPDRSAVTAYWPGWHRRRHPGQGTTAVGHRFCRGDSVKAAAVPGHSPLSSLAEVVPQ